MLKILATVAGTFNIDEKCMFTLNWAKEGSFLGWKAVFRESCAVLLPLIAKRGESG